ncbi:MAG: methionyl-tRNA formyltransferase [Treponema sp.]|nr:methionyl-tRNA formyltransferase [Treponema sp.]
MLKILYAGSPAPAATTLRLLLEKCSQGQNATASGGCSQDQNAAASGDCSQDQKGGGWQIAGVLTNPPSAKGRHKELVPTDVGLLAQERGIPVFCPQKLDAAARDQIAAQGFDALVCFAYGKIFGPKFLSLFKSGGVNVHPSLLPKYRGATPVPAAILNCDEETGVTVQTLALGMDEGEILAQEVIALDGTETTDSLLDKSAQIAAALLQSLLDKAAQNPGAEILKKGRAQEGEPSYTKTISKEDALINWNDSAKNIAAAVRAYTSEPGSWTRIGGETGETLKILKAAPLDADCSQDGQAAGANQNGSQGQNAAPSSQSGVSALSLTSGQPTVPGTVTAFDKKRGILVQCGDGLLCVTELQRQQKKAMGYKDFMNGARDFVGTRLV